MTPETHMVDRPLTPRPAIAYIAHWFPKPSETFVFHEVKRLGEMGLPLQVFTLYGRLTAGGALGGHGARVERLGVRFLPRAPPAMAGWLRKAPRRSRAMALKVLCRRWPDAENAAENLWAVLCGFGLARRFVEQGIGHIHAAWANGPATAAWVASHLTGIPFSFAAHATDIYPPDGALVDKMAVSAFVRAESRANVDHLARLAPQLREKLAMIYSGTPDRCRRAAPVPMTPPLHLLGLGRFVAKKGFDILVRACRILVDRGCDIRLTLGGAGPRCGALQALAGHLGLREKILFPGFIPYDRVPEFLQQGDIFVMASTVDPSGDRDGLPNVILEALLQRLPVVATDVCGIGEVVRHRRTGFLIPPGDPAAMAGAVMAMAADRERALAMAAQGRDLVRDRFDLDRSCGRMMNLLLANAT